jgi:hypothetical protein
MRRIDRNSESGRRLAELWLDAFGFVVKIAEQFIILGLKLVLFAKVDIESARKEGRDARRLAQGQLAGKIPRRN